MEDAELSDLTQETLLQQYRSVKKRTSMNFTYEQGSHVMQYGALTIDHEVAGDYQGMLHNGSLPPSPTPSPDWVEFEQHWHQQQQRRAGGRYLMASRGSQHSHSRGQGSSVLQRDADLVPLRHAAKHSHCPRKRAAAAKALQQVEAEREVVDAAAAAAVADLIKHPLVGHILVSNLGWLASDVLPPAALLGSSASSHEPTNSKQQQQHQQQHSPLQLGNRAEELGEVPAAFVQQLLSPLPGREGQPLVESWDCLREFVQVGYGRM
jgi:legumain